VIGGIIYLASRIPEMVYWLGTGTAPLSRAGKEADMVPTALLGMMLGFGPIPARCEGDRYNFDPGAMARCMEREAERDLLDRRILTVRCKALRIEYRSGARMNAQDYADLRECTDKGL